MDVDEAYEEMLQQERQQMTQQKAATPGGTSPNQLHTSAAGSASDEPCPMPSTSAEMSPPIASSSGLSPRRTPQSRMTGSQVKLFEGKTKEKSSYIHTNYMLYRCTLHNMNIIFDTVVGQTRNIKHEK